MCNYCMGALLFVTNVCVVHCACLGVSLFPRRQDLPSESVHAFGAGVDTAGTTSFYYDLTLTRENNDTWCMMQDASSSINTWPQVGQCGVHTYIAKLYCSQLKERGTRTRTCTHPPWHPQQRTHTSAPGGLCRSPQSAPTSPYPHTTRTQSARRIWRATTYVCVTEC